MADQLATRVIQTRAYLRPAGYRVLSDVMASQRELYNAALEHRRGAYDFHKKRCAACVENARLDERVKIHKRSCVVCADADTDCLTRADLERDARTLRRKCDSRSHAAACAVCRPARNARIALRDHNAECAECRSRKCEHKRKVDGCSGCYCEIAAPLRSESQTAPKCMVWKAKSVTKAVQSKDLTWIRAENPRLNAVDRRLSVGTLDRLEFAFDNFYRRVQEGKAPGYPRFKNADRFRTVQIYSGANNYLKSYDADTGRGAIKIKGLPTLRFRCRRFPVDQQPKDIKITLKPNGKVWLSMSFEFAYEAVSVKRDGDPEFGRKPKRGVGVDMGVNKRATLSCGERLPKRDATEHEREKRRIRRKLQRQRDAALNDGRAWNEPRRRRDGSYALGKDGKRRYYVRWLNVDCTESFDTRAAVGQGADIFGVQG